jgi:Fic-DOC domain mobile mystery protein B
VNDDDTLGAADAAATPLSPEERLGLIPTFITTRDALNEAEQLNILEAEAWAERRRRDILDIEVMRRLHRQMFGQVWRWAGNWTGQRGRRIGVDDFEVEPELRNLMDTVTYWIEHATFPPDEIAVRFHHRLTWIHPFPNGNGRFARLATDVLLRKMGRPRFSWGGEPLHEPAHIRATYVAALRSADAHDLAPLLAFVRS